MSSEMFAEFQEAMMFVFGPIATWWLVLLVVVGLILAALVLALDLARFLLSKRTDYSQGPLL